MKKLLTILILFCSVAGFSQIKDVKTGRVHEISGYEERVDSVGKVRYYVQITIYKEGIDGNYEKEITKSQYKNGTAIYGILNKEIKGVITTVK